MSAELRINADALNDLAIAVDELGSAVQDEQIRLVMGMAMMEVIRDHFAEIAQDSEHHKTAARLGASITGVYEQARSGTDAPVVETDAVSVTIHQVAVAQRFYGGPIAPVSANWLTIPARSESYGKLAGEFDNLMFILFPSGAAALVDKDTKKQPFSTPDPYFWLVKHVTQPPDPTVLPDEDLIMSQALASAESYITRVWSNNILPSA